MSEEVGKSGSEAREILPERVKRPVWLLPVFFLGFFLACLIPWAVYRQKTTRAQHAASIQAHRIALGVTNEPLPLRVSRERQASLLVESLEKRIMGRRVSYREVERVAQEIGPIVTAAAQQPEVQPALRRMAQDEGISVAAMRSRWIALQEADLLLEAGGDPDAVSPSNAVGAAQWLAGTAQGVGLKVNLSLSQGLTSQIDELKRRIAWDVYIQRPDADTAVPGLPLLTPMQAAAELPALRQPLESLRAQRRGVDERYDPGRAIFAQTRYLLRLYPRFPSADWLFQAYHGGEGGVTHTLKLYMGSAWPGTAADAIRYGSAGRPLHYEEIYFNSTPQRHVEAFGYLYGRSDDHRHYWWKLRASEVALQQYREDREALKRRWEAFLPGRPTEALWYTPLIEDSLATEADSTADMHLVEVREGKEFKFRTVTPDLFVVGHYSLLRPEAAGALHLVDLLYRKCGGIPPLTVGDMTYTQKYAHFALIKQTAKEATLPKPPLTHPALPWPPDLDRKNLPGGGPPSDFDYHTVGIAFDLPRPTEEPARKILEFTLDTLGERGILTWRDLKDRGERHYHVVPNPRYGDALQKPVASLQNDLFLSL